VSGTRLPSRLAITTTNGIAMTNAIIESIVSRSTTKYFDPAVTLSDDLISELVRIGTTAPTSFHLQNWRFIAVRTPEAKARLRPIAWDQPAITDAAVTFIVCGQLADSSVIPERLAPLVEAGIMPAKMVPEWEIPARDLYMEYPQRQRDEAVRTGTFGAAAMIYAAHALGLGSTPMIGFDAEAVAREFALADDLADDEVPVMRLSVGAALPKNWPQKARRPVADVLEFAGPRNVFDPEKDFSIVTPAGSTERERAPAEWTPLPPLERDPGCDGRDCEGEAAEV
jgi:nitroreductase